MKELRWLAFAAWVALAGCGGSDLGFGCPGADPAPPDVSGTWVYNSAAIGTSTCTQQINSQLLQIFGGSCEVVVSQSGTDITTTDCEGRVARGCVDSSGNISVTEPITSTVQGCTLTASTRLTGDLSDSPTTGTFSLPITFSGGGCGVLTNCQATVVTDWTLSSSS